MADSTQHGALAGTGWDPSLYHRFSDHRLRPALELLARVPLSAPTVVYDLGCGTGQVTRLLAERWPAAAVHGLDHSKEMLAQASREPGQVHWIEADISQWQPDQPADLIYANASLHWLEGHRELFPGLVGYLKARGCLAVQMPLNWEAPSHRLIRETLLNGGRGGRMLGTEQLRHAVGRSWVLESEIYFDLLSGCTKHVDIWETEYWQLLEGNDPVLEWVKGTGLRPILNNLDDEERDLFLAEYGRRLRLAYPARPDGRTLFPFRRLFLVATV
jgi:trans-aconitate 2-methyltransferase